MNTVDRKWFNWHIFETLSVRNMDSGVEKTETKVLVQHSTVRCKRGAKEGNMKLYFSEHSSMCIATEVNRD